MREAAVFAVAFATAYFFIRLLIPILRRRGVVDVPNARSSHQVPTPRGGGLGIIAGIAAGLAVSALASAASPQPVILVAAALIALAGGADDFLGGVSPAIRLLVQLAAAGAVVYHRGGLIAMPLPAPLDFALGGFGDVLAVIWIVAITNIFNFLDGIDGYAGAQTVLAAVGFLLISQGGSSAAVALAIAGASAGFLLHNWRPARIFMGDAGSTTLGFTLAVLPWNEAAAVRGQWVFYSALFMWFFVADGTFTVICRLFRGEKIWKPHRSHLYQQLAKRGIPHDVIVVRVSAMALIINALCVAAVAFDYKILDWLAVAAAVVLFVVYAYWAESLVPRRTPDRQLST